MELTHKIKQIKYENINLFLIIFLPISLFIGSLITNLTIILIIIFFLIDCKKKNNFFFIREKNFQFLIVIYLYMIFNSLYVGQTSDSIIRSLGFVRFLILAYAIFFYLNNDDKKYQNTIFKYWAYIFLLASVDLIFEFFFQKNILGFQSNYPARLASFTGDELKIGGYYFGFIMLTISFFYLKKKKVFYLYFLIFFIISILIGERANFLKICFMYIIFIFLILNKPIFQKFIIALIIPIISLVVIFNSPKLESKYYNQIFNIKNDERIKLDNFKLDKMVKVNKHFSHYFTAINIFKENPIFGIGMKKFRVESYKEKYNPIQKISGGSNHPHQTHFEILSELGIIGYLLIISNIFYVIIFGFKNSYKKNFFIMSSALFMIATLIPIIPSGSFFTTFTATIYWVNYSVLIVALKNRKMS